MKKYLRNISPLSVLTFSILFFVLFREFGGLIFEPISYLTEAFIFMCSVSFLLGYLTVTAAGPSRVNKNNLQDGISIISANSKEDICNKFVFRMLLFFSLCNCIVLVLDFRSLQSYFMNYSLESITVAHNLRTFAGIRFSLTGIISNITNGFPVITAAFLLLQREKIIFSNNEIVLVLISLMINLIFAFMAGGRNEEAMVIVFLLLTGTVRLAILKKSMFPPLPRFVKICSLSVFLFSIFYMLIIFLVRASVSSLNLLGMVSDFSFFGVKVGINTSGSFSSLKIIYLTLVFYITHSLNELNLLLSKLSGIGPYWGGYNFYSIVLFLNKIGFHLTDINFIRLNLVHLGTYLGLLGSIYLDFGYFGSLIFFYIYGFFVCFAWKRSKYSKKPEWMLLSVYNLLILFFAPIYSAIGIGYGLPMLIALFFLITVKWFFNLFNQACANY
ncbi:MAG: oligosaccharide repeat unit polymerase [Gammaproteobacteria bacterium]|nr:oligosaccharide repeat unit polymerase [Gammaproteobacteria bacterium]